MNFTEISRREDKIIHTVVEMVFNINGSEVKKEVDVSHFNPKDEADIAKGINNRYITEERALTENPE